MKRALLFLLCAATAAGLLAGCSKSKEGLFFFPSGSASVISANGGAGAKNGGGSGAYFNVHVRDGNSVVMTGSGGVDAAFDTTVANQFTAAANRNYGANPMDVTSNMTVKVYANNGAGGNYVEYGGAANEYHMYVGNGTLYKREASNAADNAVTGIHVHPGATLTLYPNENYYVNNGLDTAYVTSPNDVWNQGTITVVNLTAGANAIGFTGTPDGTTSDMANLDIEPAGVFLNDGTITTKGVDNSGAVGGNGGHIYLYSNTVAVNRGTITSSGGNGTVGGKGTSIAYSSGIWMDGLLGLWNSGPITATGGTGSAGNGGSGGGVGLSSDRGPVYNNATLNSSGGNGTTGGGGASWGVEMYTGADRDYYAGGDIVNSGHLIANGGNATTNGNGGAGGSDVEMGAFGASIKNTGTIEAKGGNAAGAGMTGGHGGYLYFYTDWAYDYWTGSMQASAGSIAFSGSVLADAGSGDFGGSAGDVEFYQDGSPATGDILLAGYGSISLMGGVGSSGGHGGSVNIYDNGGNVYVDAVIYNDVSINTSGGAGSATTGGSAGYVYFDGWNNPAVNAALKTQVENHGNITANGGAGVTAGGYGASTFPGIEITSMQSLVNTGHLTANGGAASNAAIGVGGGAGRIYIFAANGTLENSGQLESIGGYGALIGGAAYGVSLYADEETLMNSGNIYANGGNATVSLAGSTGGAGGSVYMFSRSPFHTQNTAGAIQANGGAGNTPGPNSIIWLDGVNKGSHLP